MKMTRTNIYITQRQHKTIKAEAEKLEITFSEVFRRIIDNYITKKKK